MCAWLIRFAVRRTERNIVKQLYSRKTETIWRGSQQTFGSVHSLSVDEYRLTEGAQFPSMVTLVNDFYSLIPGWSMETAERESRSLLMHVESGVLLSFPVGLRGLSGYVLVLR